MLAVSCNMENLFNPPNSVSSKIEYLEEYIENNPDRKSSCYLAELLAEIKADPAHQQKKLDELYSVVVDRIYSLFMDGYEKKRKERILAKKAAKVRNIHHGRKYQRFSNGPLKWLILDGYDFLLDGFKQSYIRSFPIFLEKNGFVYLSDDIEDDVYKGTSYLKGKVVHRETLKGEDDAYNGLLVETVGDGIELFEHYTERNFRPMVIIPGNKGLVVDMTELNKRPNHPRLEGKTLDDVIRINLQVFPTLMDKLKTSSETDYQAFYLSIFSKEPLLY